MRYKLTTLFCLCAFFLSAQTDYNLPEFKLQKEELAADMHFLASDFLQGRRTGEPGNTIAAHFLAEQLEGYGLVPPAGQDNYFQEIRFEATKPPTSASLMIGKQKFTQGENLMVLGGGAINSKADVVFAEHGWVSEDGSRDDYKNLNVKGKIVVVLPGEPGVDDPNAIFQAMQRKRELASERGAIALVELYRLPFPWRFFKNFFGNESLRPAASDADESGDNEMVYAWIQEDKPSPVLGLQKAKRTKGSIASSGFSIRSVYSKNVIGIIEGSDPALKDEYLLLSAHYDHVGTGSKGGGAISPADSIFNGARDNGFGSVSLLAAAKSLSQKRPKRSVAVLFVTGEELGLLGSKYYAENPIIPLEKTIFNLNTDGAGYSDTEAISIFGAGRTGTDEALAAGVAPFNLNIIEDPAPEQNLFDRSDNVSFAQKGVPALTFSPGFAEFSEEIMKNYHQVSDEAETLDFGYLKRFAQAFSHTARIIADGEKKPTWVSGDKYEEAGNELYNKKP